MLREWLVASRDRIEKKVAGLAIVLTDAVLRFTLSSVMLAIEMPYPYAVVDTSNTVSPVKTAEIATCRAVRCKAKTLRACTQALEMGSTCSWPTRGGRSREDEQAHRAPDGVDWGRDRSLRPRGRWARARVADLRDGTGPSRGDLARARARWKAPRRNDH